MRQIDWILAIIAVSVWASLPVMDPDLWWHISVGRSILDSGIPYTESWNSFTLGKPWFAYSWSNEVVYALFDQYWGDKGLVSLKMILMAVLGISLGVSYSKVAKDWFVGLILTVITMSALSAFMLLRPQTIVWAYAALALYLTDKQSEDGLSLPHLFLLALVGCLWANAHITTILGLGIVVSWYYDDSLSFKDNAREIIVIAGAFFVGTLITPYFGREWVITLFKSNHPFAHGSISEFGAANIRDYGTGMFIILVSVLLIFVHNIVKKKGVEGVRVLRLVGLVCLTVAGLGIIKFLPFALIYISSFIGVIWRDERGNLGELEIAIDKLRELVFKIEGDGRIPGTFIALVAFTALGASSWYREGVYKDKVPVDCMNYVSKNNLSGPVMNTFGDGGYVMYRLSDKNGNLSKPVSMDGRTNVNAEEVAEAHGNALGGRVRWADYLDIVKPETIIWRNISPLTSLLVQNKKWCRVYCDGDSEKGFSVFIKKERLKASMAVGNTEVWSPKTCSSIEPDCVTGLPTVVGRL